MVNYYQYYWREMNPNSLLGMLANQKVQQYLLKAIVEIKETPGYNLNPVILQISAKPSFNDVGQVTDSKIYFPCRFQFPSEAKKGTYIRVTEWKIQVDSERLLIISFQALSGADYKVNRGSKKWDISRIKQTWLSSFISHDIILVKHPIKLNRKNLQYLGVMPLTRENLSRINMSERQQEDQKHFQSIKKTRSNWEEIKELKA